MVRSFRLLQRAATATLVALSSSSPRCGASFANFTGLGEFMSTTTTVPDRLVFHHVQKAGSTQDVAREKLSNDLDKILVVTCTEQTQGRGTKGRTWMGGVGNVFVTLAVPMTKIPVTITLLPLQVGVLVAERVEKLLLQHKENTVRVKWPNDVLLNDKKVSGVLIESHLDSDKNVWLLIGIGVNLVQAPRVPNEGPNRGRPATSIQAHIEAFHTLPLDLADIFTRDLAIGFEQWLSSSSSGSKETLSTQVLENWRLWADLGGTRMVIRDTNEEVVPIDIIKDGQLKVLGANGQERLLVAEYLH